MLKAVEDQHRWLLSGMGSEGGGNNNRVSVMTCM